MRSRPARFVAPLLLALTLGCGSAEVCDACEENEDCDGIEAEEGAQCFQGLCCIVSGDACSERALRAQCPAHFDGGEGS